MVQPARRDANPRRACAIVTVCLIGLRQPTRRAPEQRVNQHQHGAQGSATLRLQG